VDERSERRRKAKTIKIEKKTTTSITSVCVSESVCVSVSVSVFDWTVCVCVRESITQGANSINQIRHGQIYGYMPDTRPGRNPRPG